MESDHGGEGFVKQMDSDNENGTVKKRCVQDEVNQEESEQDEVDATKNVADSTGKVTHIERAVM